MAKLTFKTNNLPVCIYPAVVSAIDTTDGDYGLTIKWRFDLEVDRSSYPVRRTGYSSLSTGPRSKARRWASAILGRPIEEGEEIDTYALVGRRCHVALVLKNGAAGPYDVIAEVLPLAAPRTAADNGEGVH